MIQRALSCWRTVLALHAILLLFAFLGALPVWSFVAGSIGTRPEGDLALWQPGGVLLADFFTLERARTAPIFRGISYAAVLFALVALPLSAGLFATLREGRDLGPERLFVAATRRLGAFFVVWILHVVGLLALGAGGGYLAYRVLDHFVEHSPDPGRGLVLAALTLLPFLGILLVLAVAADVVRAGIAAGRPRVLETWLAALRQVARYPLRFCAPYAAFGLSTWGVTLVVAALGDRLGGRPGASAVALFAAAHLGLVVRSFLRAAWVAAAASLAEAYLAAPAGPVLDRPSVAP